MAVKNQKASARERRKIRIRKKVVGTPDRPRLCVFKSNKHMYVQVIDDEQGRTLAAASTVSPELRDRVAKSTKTEAARLVGQLAAQRCLASNIREVVFDRNGFLYKGRVSAVADAAREGGLKF